jgi:hypothetical protein
MSIRRRSTVAGDVRQQPGGATVDALIEAYVAWREECSSVHAAYAGWTHCAPASSELAFAGYRAALEREEQAASVYGNLTAIAVRSAC